MAQTAAWLELKETCITGAGGMTELASRAKRATQV